MAPIVRSAEDGARALKEASRLPPDLVITDLAMPVLSGFDVLAEFRRLTALADVPVIVVSDVQRHREARRGLNLGADDFLAKPVHADELLARVRRHLQRSDRQREVARQSMVDALTGVLNRRGLANFFARELERTRAEGTAILIMMIDLNDFKRINDTWGHAVGDTALCVVARALQDELRTTDRIGRMGGDEFAIVLPEVRSGDCQQLAQRIRRISPIVIELAAGAEVRVGLSLGLALAEPGEAFDAVLARADVAMYEDKRRQAMASESLS
jgi:diguanylate cyclase (GGDEF)-like protein